ncbi:hypothetical protein BD626DRAFT_573531 [Schizophyllum amplum]|uniref:Uncharacterized protein n=1 Tax=Schizophyllum amplum TaxID=97359 RepID=A0A550C153_9AGAR|nr:hypothetical protein BD626DRAFT_573531 [Auriculariopsis ampla]
MHRWTRRLKDMCGVHSFREGTGPPNCTKPLEFDEAHDMPDHTFFQGWLDKFRIRRAQDFGSVRRGQDDVPIHRLPVELLSQIFMHCLEFRGVVTLCAARLDSLHQPIILSHVCALWRDLAIDLPALWRRLSLHPCNGRINQYQLGRLFIARAKNLPLIVEYEDAVFERDICPCALNLVVENLAKIGQLDLWLTQSSVRRFSLLPTDITPSLERLSVQVCPGDQEHVQLSMLQRVYTTSPKLHALCWGSPEFPPNVPWSQLVDLCMSPHCQISHSSLAYILSSTPRLQELIVTICPVTQEDVIPSRAIPQGHLRYLDFTVDGPLDGIFQVLCAPLLESMTLRPHSAAGWYFSDESVVVEFLNRATRGLQSLALLAPHAFSVQCLLSCLSLPQSSSILSLHMHDLPALDDNFFERLDARYSHDGTYLLPRLEKLDAGYCVTTDGIIASMVRSRIDDHHPLHHANFDYKPGEAAAHPMDVSLLEDLQRSGTDITWW